MSLLRPNIIGTLERVTHKEDREIEANEVVIAVLGIEFDSVSPWISSRVRIFPTVSDSRESAEDGGVAG
jgi:DNA-binding transcriptional regulator YdaS (Cro superfamily)